MCCLLFVHQVLWSWLGVDGDKLSKEKEDELNDGEKMERDWNEMNVALVDYSNDYM